MQVSPDPLSTPKFWLDVADKAVKALALLVGAVWTYLGYRRGRTFARRLEPAVAGRLIERDGKHFLMIISTVKNVGLSKVPLQQRGTACTLFALTVDKPVPGSGPPADIVELFREHDWLEPGEIVGQSDLVPLPFYSDKLLGIRLQIRVVSPAVRLRNIKIVPPVEWNASSIVDCADPNGVPVAVAPPVAWP
jgi:hypothetical protein